MLRSRPNKRAALPQTEWIGQRDHGYHSKHKRKKENQISHHTLILGFMTIATFLEVVYLSSLGAFRNSDIWNSMFGRSFRFSSILDSTIDNYYSRAHIKSPVPLIVGGSDGSGTRAFVQVLELLDVPMVVDDRGTMDVHAKELFQGRGWPALISKVLNYTHSATYDLEFLPEDVKTLCMTELNTLMEDLESRGTSRHESSPGSPRSSAASWGFKAPVSQLLLPFFRKQLPAFKFLHIIRDGRDVALSDNHSPVRKFYSYYYEDAVDRNYKMKLDDFGDNARAQIEAMQLWNDWNKAIFEYGKRYSDGKTFEVLVMRTEDFLDYPFESVVKLADFVGSPKTPHDLCCISRQVASDLGQSDSGGRAAHAFGGFGSIADFEQIRERFEQFVPKEAQKAWERKHPDKSFDDVKKALLTTVEQHEEYAASGNNTKRGGSGSIRRRLVENDDKIDVFVNFNRQRKEALPANVPGGGDVKSGENLRNTGAAHQSYDQVMRMQKLLEERRKVRLAPKSESAEDVKQRYGKWIKNLEGNPMLSERLHREGRESLRIFGYEPQEAFMDAQSMSWSCDSTIVCQNSEK